MSWVCEIAVTGDPARSKSLAAWLSRSRAQLASLAEIDALDAYDSAAEPAQDPYNPEETPPLLLVLANFASEAGLRQALASPVLAEVLAALPAGLAVTVSGLRRGFYPPDEGGTMPAPVSYVVRYLRPAQDEAAFVRAYVATLVPIQVRLPGIRSLMCYFRIAGAAAPGQAAMDYLVGNEVAFDSVEAFNAAMRSPARGELRTQSQTLPACTGGGTHVLMRRRRLLGD